MGQTFELQDHLAPQRRRVNGTALPAPGGSDLVTVYMAELDDMRQRIIAFATSDPADVLGDLSAISGRLAEMRAQLYRDNSQRCQALRTREVDPLREECELQFKIHSRRIALLEWELK